MYKESAANNNPTSLNTMSRIVILAIIMAEIVIAAANAASLVLQFEKSQNVKPAWYKENTPNNHDAGNKLLRKAGINPIQVSGCNVEEIAA